MFAPGGILGSELGDVEVIEVGDTLHLFYLCVPNHDIIGHAISRDGLSWEIVEPALTTGPPGSDDDDMLWTMSVTRHGDEYVMLYTALSTRDGGRVQRVAAARSYDLNSWEKLGTVSEADPSFYEAEVGPGMRWVSWRDPKPVQIGDEYWATICAREPNGPFLRRGAVAVITSPDLRNWRATEPLYAPGRHFEFECPQLFRLGERYYLLASVHEERTMRYWVANSPRGPYRAIGDNRVFPLGEYAGRVCEFRGQPLLFSWREGDRGRYMAPPVRLEAEQDGRLRFLPFEGAAPGPKRALEEIDLGGGSGPHHDLPRLPRSFALEYQIEGDASRFGIELGVDAAGQALIIELDPGARSARVTRYREAVAEDGSPWFAQDLLADGPLFSQARRVRLLLRRKVLELVVDGRLILRCAVSPTSDTARLFAEGGTHRATGITVLALPETAPQPER